MTLRVCGSIEIEAFVVDIDLEVARGETVALVGPNGAGKSTVLRAITGLLPLRSGRIELDGRTWDGPDTFVPPADRRVGTVFQSYRLFDHLDARENVAFGLRARGIRRRDALAAAQAALERLGVGGSGDQRPPSLSGGQAQLVAVADRTDAADHLGQACARHDGVLHVEIRRDAAHRAGNDDLLLPAAHHLQNRALALGQ